MSDFLERVGRITEWVVISNLENRAVNAACNKAQGWWNERKHKKHDKSTPEHTIQNNTAQHTSTDSKSCTSSSYGQAQPSGAAAATNVYSTPSAGPGHLFVTFHQVDGFNLQNPLIIIMECNHERLQMKINNPVRPGVFPIYQFDQDLFYIWIRDEYSQSILGQVDIPVKILLNGNINPGPAQYRWIPLRDHNGIPSGQILILVEYRSSNATPNYASGPSPPPPYSYY